MTCLIIQQMLSNLHCHLQMQIFTQPNSILWQTDVMARVYCVQEQLPLPQLSFIASYILASPLPSFGTLLRTHVH